MSMIRWGDEDMHYSDSSHRWIAPPEIDQEVWNNFLRTHLAAHLDNPNGPDAPANPVPHREVYRPDSEPMHSMRGAA